MVIQPSLYNPAPWHTIVRRRSQTADSCDSAVETTFSSTLPQEPNRESEHMLPHASIAMDRDITRLSVDGRNAGQAPSRRLPRRAGRIRRSRARGRPPDNPTGSLRCLPLSPGSRTLTEQTIHPSRRRSSGSQLQNSPSFHHPSIHTGRKTCHSLTSANLR